MPELQDRHLLPSNGLLPVSSQAGLAPGAGLPSCRVCGGGFLPLGSRPFSLQLPKESAVLHHKEKMSKVKRFWCGWLREKRLVQSFTAGPEITHSSVYVALTTLLSSKGTDPFFFLDL